MRDKAIVSAYIKTAITFIALIVLVFGYFATSFGWFATNKDVSANGNVVTADGIAVEITQVNSVGGVVNNEDLTLKFERLFPNDTVSAIIEITCYKQINLLTIGLYAPQGCETPIVNQGKNYYFGSQIIISSLAFNGESLESSVIGKSLFSSTPESDWGLTEEKIPTDIDIFTFTNLNVGTYTVVIDFTFYNAPYSQNQLKDFGLNGETCYRLFKII